MQGGKPFYDRKLAGDVRTKALEDVLIILSDEKEDVKKTERWSKLKKEMIMKLSTNLLPRLNEITGSDGEELKITFDESFKDK